MPFDQNQLPTWNKEGVEPPQSLKDDGWQPSQKPPADYFNWFFNKTFKALQSLFTNAQHKEEKGQPNGYASLDENAKVPTSQLPIATTTSPGAISASDKVKLDGIQSGAEVNQNAFSNVKVGATTIAADNKTDTLELVAGNAVTITPDATNDRVTIAVPNATSSTPGAMSAADKAKLDGIAPGAEVNQNAFTNVKVGTTTISADSKTDTLELVAGANIVLTPDAANDKVTIDVTGVAPSSHTHPFSDITNKPTTVDGYGITDAVKTSDVVTSPAPNKILKLDANGKLPTSITGNADGNAATASKLQTARTISLSGDVTGSTSFDGSSNVSINATLANSGVTPGTYPKVTVDAKGRVTGGQALSPSDIPNMDWSKITSGKPTTLSGYGITDGVPIGRKINVGAGLTGGGDLSSDRTISVSFGGNGSATTVARSDHNHDGTYVKKSGDTMTGRLQFGAGQDIAPDAVSGTTPSQGIRFSADTDIFDLFLRTDNVGEKSGLILALGDNADDYFQIEQVSPSGEATPTKLFKISETLGAEFYTTVKVNGQNVVLENQKGQPNGVATLDGNTKVPTSQLPSASTSAPGIVQLNDTVTSTSTTQAATARAVKQAYDLANAAIPSSQKGQPNGVATLDENGKVINADGTYPGGVSEEDFAAHLADYVKHPAYAVATGSANAYSVTLNPAPTSYVEGMAIAVKINVDNTGAATINVNGLGAKAIKKPNGNDVSAGNLKAGSIYTLRYNGANFILQGEGGDLSDTDKSNLINSINAIYDM
jgi:phage-related tail fiber protein